MPRVKTVVWSLLLLSGMMLLATSCSRQKDPLEPEGVVARVGTHFITQNDIQLEVQRRKDAGQRVGSAAELMDELLLREALLIRAEQSGVTNDPDVQRDIDRLLISRLRERELAEKLQAFRVTDAEVHAEYMKTIEKYTRPALDRFSILFLQLQASASAEKTEQVITRMMDARDVAASNSSDNGFGALSVSCSDDQASRYRGGDIGWIARNKETTRIPESVLETARALNVGDMSDILSTEDGLYLVMKTDTRPAVTTAYEQVQGSVRQRMLAEGRKRVEDAYLSECISAANPDVNQRRLNELGLYFEEIQEPSESVSVLAVGSPMSGPQ